MEKIIESVKKGTPVYMRPYKEPKVWGINGIGEYWYGAEPDGKSSIGVINDDVMEMADLVEACPEEFLGKGVVKRFGKMLPLIKILSPKGRLSVQFHDKKNELWIVTGIDRSIAGENPSIIMGFNHKVIGEYGDSAKQMYRDVLENYGLALNRLVIELEKRDFRDLLLSKKSVIEAARIVSKGDQDIAGFLERFEKYGKELEKFYNYHEVHEGDVIPVQQGTLHALGPGIEVVEPQIPGPTQSMEDGDTYPIRYYFPDFKVPGAQKMLDLDRIAEINAAAWEIENAEVISESDGMKIERLPGGFESKGMTVERICVSKGKSRESKLIKSYHSLVLLEGTAEVIINKKSYSVPKAGTNGEMLIIPASCGSFEIFAEEKTQIIDTFTPVG